MTYLQKNQSEEALNVINPKDLTVYEKSLTVIDTNEARPMANYRGPDVVTVKMNLDLIIRTAVKALNIQMDEIQIGLLIEDILAEYKNESFEDLTIFFSNLRRGHYGPTYGSLNMIYIRPAMEKYLNQKYERRERSLHNERIQRSKDDHDFRTREEYIEAVKRGAENLKKIEEAKKQRDRGGESYNNFKAKYLAELEEKKKNIE